MDNVLLLAAAVLPLGLVAYVAIKMLKGKKKPELKLVESAPAQEAKPKKARKAKRKPARGKRK